MFWRKPAVILSVHSVFVGRRAISVLTCRRFSRRGGRVHSFRSYNGVYGTSRARPSALLPLTYISSLPPSPGPPLPRATGQRQLRSGGWCRQNWLVATAFLLPLPQSSVNTSLWRPIHAYVTHPDLLPAAGRPWFQATYVTSRHVHHTTPRASYSATCITSRYVRHSASRGVARVVAWRSVWEWQRTRRGSDGWDATGICEGRAGWHLKRVRKGISTWPKLSPHLSTAVWKVLNAIFLLSVIHFFNARHSAQLHVHRLRRLPEQHGKVVCDYDLLFESSYLTTAIL